MDGHQLARGDDLRGRGRDHRRLAAAYARAFGTDGPATVVTFQAAPDEYEALRAAGHPYHHPPWRPGIVGVVVDNSTDWTELAELVVDSYRECGGRRGRWS